MNYKTNYLKFLLGIMLLGNLSLITSCEKETATVEPPDGGTPLYVDTLYEKPEAIWSSMLNPDSLFSQSMETILYNNLVISSSVNANAAGVVCAFDQHSGQLVWEWSDFLPDDNHQFFLLRQTNQVIDNYLYCQNRKARYCINLDNGNTVWRAYEDWSGSFSNTFENNMLRTITHGKEEPYIDSTDFYISPISSNEWKKIYTFRRTDDYDANVPNFTMEINPDGDTILYFQARRLRPDPSLPYSGRIDLYALNLTQDSILWVQQKINASGNSNVQPLTISNDLLYFAGSHTLFCYDKEFGDPIWKHQAPSSLLTSNYIIHNDLLIYKTDIGHTQALNRFTGNLIWETNTVYCCAGFIASGDVLCLNGTYLYLIDLTDGTILYKLKTPGSPNGYFHTRFAWDLEKNTIYGPDGFQIHEMIIPPIAGFNAP